MIGNDVILVLFIGYGGVGKVFFDYFCRRNIKDMLSKVVEFLWNECIV